MLLEINPPLVYAERRPLEREILLFWNHHNFEGRSPLVRAETALPEIFPVTVQEFPETTVQVISPEEKNEEITRQGGLTWNKVRRRKTTLLGIGIGLTVIGAAAQGVVFARYGGSNENIGRYLYYAGYIPLTMGLASLLWGTLYNPMVSPE